MRDKFTKLILVVIIFIVAIGAILVTAKYQTEMFLRDLQKNLTEQLNRPVFIENVKFEWVGYDIKINIDNFVVRDKGSDVPILTVGNVKGLLSPIGSILRLNIRFKELNITSLKLKLALNSHQNLHLSGLLGQQVHTNNNETLLKLIFGQENLTVVDSNITISDAERDILLKYSKIKIIENGEKSIFKMNGTVNEAADAHYILTGEYADSANINFNAQFNNLSVDNINSFLPHKFRIFAGKIAQATISGQTSNSKIETLNFMFVLDNVIIDKKYNLQQGKLQLLYRKDLDSGRFSVHDFKMLDMRNPQNSLNISEMSADLIVDNHQISTSNLQTKINDFNALFKIEISNNTNGTLDVACLADFEGLKVDYVKKWLNDDFIPPSVLHWINSAVSGGFVTHLYAQLDQTGETFQVDFGNTTLKYADNWPKIDNLNTTLNYHNQILSLENSSGVMLDLPIKVSKAVFSDIGSYKFSHLTINGMSETDVEKAIVYLEQTPLKDKIASKAEVFKPKGQMTLNLNLDLIFNGDSPTILINGLLNLLNGSINIPYINSDAQDINGTFEFSDYGVQSQDLSFKLLDNQATAKLSFDKNINDIISFDLDYTVDLNKFNEILKNEQLNKVLGTTFVQANLAMHYDDPQKNTVLKIKSSLEGIESKYPYPLSKTADEILPITITYKFSDNNLGNVETLIRGYDLTYDLEQHKLSFVNEEVDGSLTIHEKLNKYKLALNYLDLDKLLANKSSNQKMTLDGLKNIPKPIILETDFKKIIYKNYAIENFSFQLLPRSYGYQIVDLSINNKDMHLQAQGQWQTKGDEFTQLSGNVYSEDFGKIISLVDTNSSISKCNGEINFSLELPGDITNFRKDNLEGIVKVVFGDGVINNVKPGFGKVLGLLSLEGVQRRLQLDFSDLTTQGLAFDRLTANYEFNKTVVSTKDLNIQAPAAQIALAGDIHLDTKEIDLSMLIVPRVGAGIPIAAAIATGNPAIGAAIWLFDKAAGLQFMDFAQFNYKITGTFEKPIITEVEPSKTGTKS